MRGRRTQAECSMFSRTVNSGNNTSSAGTNPMSRRNLVSSQILIDLPVRMRIYLARAVAFPLTST